MKTSVQKIINTILILSFMLFGLHKTCLAEEASVLKIGVINTQSLENCLYATDIQKKLEKEFNPRGDKFQAKKQELESKQELLQRDKAVLSEKERIAKERELTKLQQEAQHMLETLETEFKSRQQEELIAFKKIVDNAVANLAKQEKYALIFPEQVVLYSIDAFDCTDKIIKILDTQFKNKK